MAKKKGKIKKGSVKTPLFTKRLNKYERKALKRRGINLHAVKRVDKIGRTYFVNKKTGIRVSRLHWKVTKQILREAKPQKAIKKREKARQEYTFLGYPHPSSLETLVSDTYFDKNGFVSIKTAEGDIINVPKLESWKLLGLLGDIKEQIIEDNTDPETGKLVDSDFLRFRVSRNLKNDDLLIDLGDFEYKDQDFEVSYYFYKYF